MNIYIIMYHYVRDLGNSRYPQIKGLDINYFKTQLDFLEKNYQIISVDELLNNPSSYNGGGGGRDCALLTFDDGYIDHYTNVFPLLAARGISGFFSMPGKIIKEEKVLDVNKIHFLLASVDTKELLNKVFRLLDYYRGKEFEVPENDDLYTELAASDRFDNKDIVFIKRLLQYKLDETLRNFMANDLFKEFVPISERAFSKELYMNMAQVKLMKKQGMHFGIHGYDHYWLGLLDTESMKRDVSAALDVFNEVIDRNNWVMCYPYGSFNIETLKYLMEIKCSFGFTTEVAVARLPTDKPLELPRLDTNDFPPKSKKYRAINNDG